MKKEKTIPEILGRLESDWWVRGGGGEVEAGEPVSFTIDSI